MSIAKYKPGRKIRTLNALLDEIDKYGLVFLREKPIHHGWVRCFQFNTVLLFLRGGSFRKVELTEYGKKVAHREVLNFMGETFDKYNSGVDLAKE
jgi:hypothetical protein